MRGIRYVGPKPRPGGSGTWAWTWVRVRAERVSRRGGSIVDGWVGGWRGGG